MLRRRVAEKIEVRTTVSSLSPSQGPKEDVRSVLVRAHGAQHKGATLARELGDIAGARPHRAAPSFPGLCTCNIRHTVTSVTMPHPN